MTTRKLRLPEFILALLASTTVLLLAISPALLAAPQRAARAERLLVTAPAGIECPVVSAALRV